MAGLYSTVPASRSDQNSGDEVVFRCAACALGCGAAAAAAAAFGCTDQVLGLFAPELGFLLLVPSLLIALVGAVGLCASYRLASKFFRVQLAVFLMVLAAMLGGAGCFAFISSGQTAQWIINGCEEFTAEGLWDQAGRIEKLMSEANQQHHQLHAGWLRCRTLNPLVYDLSNCGVRGKCADGKFASEQPMYAWFQHVQLAFACGGYCTDEVPLFGPVSMRDTLVSEPACALKAAASVEFLGHVLGVGAGIFSLPVVGVALALSVAATREEDDDYEEVRSGSEDEGDEGGYSRSPSGYARVDSEDYGDLPPE